MAHFVRNQTICAFQALARERRVQQAARREGRCASVLHSAQDELIHGCLVILVPRIRHAQSLRKKAEHLGRARKRRLDAIRFSPWHTIVHGKMAPGFLALVEFARHQRNQIRGDRLRLPPRPRLHIRPGIHNVLKPAVRHGHPIARNSDNHFRCRAVVRVVVDGNVIAGLFGLPLRPNFLGLCRGTLIRQDEIETLLRIALVTNGHLVLFAGFAGAAEIHVQFCLVGRKAHLLSVEAGAQNCQTDGIEIQLAQAVLQRRERVRDLADHLPLIQIKPQFDSRVLQVVVAAARKGLIRASLRPNTRSQGD